tara:strand:+ start:49 stop:387 length:339 start_codon:yes stop_codon:yes gene_type:complete
MKVIERTFNTSVKESLSINNKFDNSLRKFSVDSNKSFYELLNIVSSNNNITFQEKETYNEVLKIKNFSFEILHNDVVVKSISNGKNKNKNISKWLGKHLLYYIRDNHKNLIK